MKLISLKKYFPALLWLIALHSFLVGLGLIFVPNTFLEYLGYGKCVENFFRTQGGVFHIAMAIGYSLAAYNSKKNECLVIFSIIVKFLATIFLFSYFIFINPLLVILLSGISDFIMGILILSFYQLENKRTKLN